MPPPLNTPFITGSSEDRGKAPHTPPPPLNTPFFSEVDGWTVSRTYWKSNRAVRRIWKSHWKERLGKKNAFISDRFSILLKRKGYKCLLHFWDFNLKGFEPLIIELFYRQILYLYSHLKLPFIIFIDGILFITQNKLNTLNWKILAFIFLTLWHKI